MINSKGENNLYCKFCGAKNAPNAAFCKNCGQPLTQARTTAESQPDQQKVTQTRSDQHRSGGARQPKKRGPWPLIIGAVVLIVAIGGYVYYQNGQSEQQAAPSTKSSRSTSKATVAKKDRVAQSVKTTKAPKPSTSAKSSFPKAAVKQVVDQQMAALGGTSSVAVEPVTGNGVVVSHNRSQRAASVIKLFILATVYQQVADKKLNLASTYQLKSSDKVGGTGTLQTLPNGSDLTYKEITKRMIDESDNTAANIMIDTVGGLRVVNQEISRLGLSQTKLGRHLMDTTALQAGKDNYTSVEDVAKLLKQMYNRRLVSKQADKQMLSILKQNVNHTKLPHDLPSDAVVYNKTGEYNQYGVQNDAAIIKNRHGAFVVVVLSQDGKEQTQVAAMNKLGLSLYQTILEK